MIRKHTLYDLNPFKFTEFFFFYQLYDLYWEMFYLHLESKLIYWLFNSGSSKIYSIYFSIIRVYFQVIKYHFMYIWKSPNSISLFLPRLCFIVVINTAPAYFINPIFYVSIKTVLFFKDLNHNKKYVVVTIFGALHLDSDIYLVLFCFCLKDFFYYFL